MGARALTHQQWLGQIQGAISVKMAHSCAGDGAMWGEKMVRNDEHTMDIASKKIQKCAGGESSICASHFQVSYVSAFFESCKKKLYKYKKGGWDL